MALVAVLLSLYTLSYSGLPISNDERYLFDNVESLARRGNFDFTYLFDLRPHASLIDDSPWNYAIQEPLQVVMAVPLFAVAERLPVIGLMHSVWTFNIFITTLTALLLFAGGVRLGYTPTVAWMTAFLFGVATIAWPYSQTFFRESLAGLFVLAAFFAAYEVGATDQNHRVRALGLAGLMFMLVLATKSAMVMIAPALLILMLPRSDPRAGWRYVLGGLGLMFIMVGVVLLAGEWLTIQRFQWSYWQRYLHIVSMDYILESLAGYMISPGRSVWLFSPVLLLGLVGAGMLVRRGEWRLPATVLGMLFIFVISYGAGRTYIWWGGTSWGPRQLVPIVPVLVVLLLPVMAHLLRSGTHWAARMGAIVLVIVSMGVQLLGVLVSINKHYEVLAAEGLIVWQEGIWSWQWAPIPQHFALLNVQAPDVGWHFAPSASLIVGVLLLSLVMSAVCALWLLVRNSLARWPVAGLMCSVILTLGALGFGIYDLRDDPRYVQGGAEALPMIAELHARAEPGDAVFIQPLGLQSIFMNRFKSPVLTVTLPYAPGENYDPAVDDDMPAQPPEDLLGWGARAMMDWTARHYDRLWLVVNTSPSLPVVLRPTERYLAENYYPVEEFEFSQFARLIRFHPQRTPSEITMLDDMWDFGEQIRLTGLELPAGDVFGAGDVVPVSLAWTPNTQPERDYLFSVQISPRDAPPVVQRDGLPQGTFGRTSRWLPGETYHDHHGLQIPADLTPGEYVLQIIVYSFPELERLPVRLGDGTWNENGVAIIADITIE